MEPEKWANKSSHEHAFIQARREAVRTDIAKRLRKVCSHLSDEEFAELVETMVEQKLKGERAEPIAVTELV